MIPNQVIYDDRLSNEAKVLFCYIKSLSSNYRNLRNSNLRSKLGCSMNTLQNAKNQLIKYPSLINSFFAFCSVDKQISNFDNNVAFLKVLNLGDKYLK